MSQKTKNLNKPRSYVEINTGLKNENSPSRFNVLGFRLFTMKNGLQESGWIKEVRMDYRSQDGLQK